MAVRRVTPAEAADNRWVALSQLEPAIRAAVAQQGAIAAPTDPPAAAAAHSLATRAAHSTQLSGEWCLLRVVACPDCVGLCVQ